MKKLIVVCSAFAALALAGAASAKHPMSWQGAEGCVLGQADTCSYTPTSPGGFVGTGEFTITLIDDQDNVIAQLGQSDQQGCAQWGPAGSNAKYPGVATVVVQTGTGYVAAGDPFPTPLQGTASGLTVCN